MLLFNEINLIKYFRYQKLEEFSEKFSNYTDCTDLFSDDILGLFS